MSQSQNIERNTSAEAPPPPPDEYLCCEVHPSGSYFLSAQRDGQINLYDISLNPLRRLMDGHAGAVTEAHFSTSGTSIYSSSKDSTIAEWDASLGIKKNTLTGHINGVNCVQGAREDPTVLCSGSKDGTVRLWDLRGGHCIVSLIEGAEINATAFSENRKFIFSGGVDRNVKIWSLYTCSVICVLQGYKGTIKGLSLSPCGVYLLTYSSDNQFCVWDVRPYRTGQRFLRFFPSVESSRSGIMRCCWSPDGKWVSVATLTRTTNVFDITNGESLCELAAQRGRINSVAFHPFEPKVLTASSRNSHVWHTMPL